MTLIDVSPGAQRVCEDQGWNDQSLIFVLLSFIQLNVANASEKLAAHAQLIADEENTQEDI